MHYYQETAQQLPIREVDVVIADAVTTCVIAALAAVRIRTQTMLIEAKSYRGKNQTLRRVKCQLGKLKSP